MIGKVPKAGRGFKGLVSYLLFGERPPEPGDPQPSKRVAWCETRNMLVRRPDLAPRLMRATAKKSRRVVSPVYHYVISWHPDEAPSDDLMRQVADTTCADLGLAEHQLLYVAHRDTDHHHVHIVVNRVHPESGTAWNRRQDWVKIEQSLRRQSEAMGMDVVPGRHTEPHMFADVPKRAGDGEVRLGKKLGHANLDRHWTREVVAARRQEFLEIFRKASSWDQLARALDVKGYRLLRKGQGVVIADDQGVMKLSSVGKGIRLSLLEERFHEPFGDFLSRNRSSLQMEGMSVVPPEASPSFRTEANSAALALELARLEFPGKAIRSPEPTSDDSMAPVAPKPSMKRRRTPRR